jgi:lipopolysaccharide transport system permease protein
MSDNITTYQPDNSIRQGYMSMLKEICGEISRNRWLIYQLFKRDFLTLYKQSFLGIFWAVLIPLIGVGTFIILNRSGIFSIGELKVPYTVYAILGMAFWQLFSVGLITSSNCLVKAGSMIARINFSKKSLVIASVAQAIVPFLIQLILVVVLLISYRIRINVYMLFAPLLAIPIMLLTLGLGFISSLVNGIMRDIGNVISTSITFLMFLTPVLYVKPATGILSGITKYNLLHYLISVPRDLILAGASNEWRGFAAASAVSVFIFIVCLVTFHLTETRVGERI